MEPTYLIPLTGINFMDVLKEVLHIVPVAIPAVIGFTAFRKGYGFLKSIIKGA